MKVLYATDNGCFKYKNEHFLSIGLYTIAQRYAIAFKNITLYSRCRKWKKIPVGCKKADFIEQYIDSSDLKNVILKKNILLENKIRDCDLVISRLPSFTGYKVFNYCQKYKVKFLSEVMGDPWDQYWNHGIMGKIIAPYMYFKLKQVLKKSNYAIYVTDHFLQNRYFSKCPSISASNVSLDEVNEYVLDRRLKKQQQFDSKNFSLLTTASIDVAYKGQRYVIEAIRLLKQKGINVTYYLVGMGKREYLQKYIDMYHVNDNVFFLGGLPHEDVFKILDNVDVYIQPSLQEGLPRAVIEAMSRGCICYGSQTAGIPELLEENFIFKRKSARDIANYLGRIDQINLKEASIRNFNYAKNYTNELLDKKRNDFFQLIKIDLEQLQ